MSTTKKGPIVPIQKSSRPTDPRVRIGHINIHAHNFEEMKSFYVDIIGLDVISEVRGNSAWWDFFDKNTPEKEGLVTFLSAGGGDSYLSLALDNWRPEGSYSPIDHIAFQYPTKESLGELAKRLQEAKWPITRVADWGTNISFYLVDPDQNGLEFTWDRPIEEWPQYLDSNGHIKFYEDSSLSIEKIIAWAQ